MELKSVSWKSIGNIPAREPVLRAGPYKVVKDQTWFPIQGGGWVCCASFKETDTDFFAFDTPILDIGKMAPKPSRRRKRVETTTADKAEHDNPFDFWCDVLFPASVVHDFLHEHILLKDSAFGTSLNPSSLIPSFALGMDSVPFTDLIGPNLYVHLPSGASDSFGGEAGNDGAVAPADGTLRGGSDSCRSDGCDSLPNVCLKNITVSTIAGLSEAVEININDRQTADVCGGGSDMADCLTGSFQALGLAVDPERGPLWALRDGRRLLEPLGLTIVPVPTTSIRRAGLFVLFYAHHFTALKHEEYIARNSDFLQTEAIHFDAGESRILSLDELEDFANRHRPFEVIPVAQSIYSAGAWIPPWSQTLDCQGGMHSATPPSDLVIVDSDEESAHDPTACGSVGLGPRADTMSSVAAHAYRELRPAVLHSFERVLVHTSHASVHDQATTAGADTVAWRDSYVEELENALLGMFRAQVPLDFIEVLKDDESSNLSDIQKRILLTYIDGVRIKFQGYHPTPTNGHSQTPLTQALEALVASKIEEEEGWPSPGMSAASLTAPFDGALPGSTARGTPASPPVGGGSPEPDLQPDNATPGALPAQDSWRRFMPRLLTDLLAVDCSFLQVAADVHRRVNSIVDSMCLAPCVGIHAFASFLYAAKSLVTKYRCHSLFMFAPMVF